MILSPLNGPVKMSPGNISPESERVATSGRDFIVCHASRGRAGPRRLPERTRVRILELARARYAGFNDHHLCERLCEVESLSIGRRPSAACCVGAGRSLRGAFWCTVLLRHSEVPSHEMQHYDEVCPFAAIRNKRAGMPSPRSCDCQGGKKVCRSWSERRAKGASISRFRRV
jgi:hypothetical protein